MTNNSKSFKCLWGLHEKWKKCFFSLLVGNQTWPNLVAHRLGNLSFLND